MKSLIKNNLSLFVAGFGCCKQEVFAASGPIYDISKFGINYVNIPQDADVLIIQGFYNNVSEERLIKYYKCMKDPKWVVAIGKCVVDRNLLNKNYEIVKKLANKIKIDFFVPGCPPRPEAIIYCLLKLIELK